MTVNSGSQLELLTAISDALPAGVFLVNTEGRIVFANRRAVRLFGYTEDELVGLEVDALVPHPFRSDHVLRRAEFWEAPTERLLRPGRRLTASRKDESEFGVEIAIAPVRFDGASFVVVQVVDVTDLVPTRTDFEELLDSIDGIIFECDAVTFQMNYVSARAEGILGYPTSSWLKDPNFWANHIHEEDRDRAVNFCTHETKSCRDHEFEYRMIAADGRIVWMHEFIRVIRAEGVPLRVRGVMVDITARKQAEEERRALEERLQHAQKMESLAVLAGGIAHDFNNLLVGVLGNAELVLEDLPPESPILPMVNAIQMAARRAADLTHQMLAYSGKGSFRTEAIDLNRLLGEMTHLLQASIAKTAIIKFDLTPGLPRVLADATQIRQVIMNLLTNASDAIGNKSGVIAIRSGLVEADRNYLSGMYLDDGTPPGRYLTLEVSDTGCGMDAETMDKMFDPFFTTKFTGRGLGLAATVGIVHGHNGALKVYSELGRGTTVKVLLPVVASPSPAEDSPRELSDDPVHTGHALVIDDDETVCSVLKQKLERMGFEVTCAGDGRQGLAALKELRDSVRIVFLDLTMPHMDGEETFREIRNLGARCPVVLMSGYNQQDVTNNFVGKGLAGFLQKPFDLESVSVAVNEALEG